MNYQHKELASGRWNELALIEQLANIGSEVQRALNWKKRGNSDYCLKAFERALELFDLTLGDSKNKFHLKEISRAREFLADYFYGKNEFAIPESFWQAYFYNFAFAARKKEN